LLLFFLKNRLFFFQMVDDDDWTKKQSRVGVNPPFPPKLKIGAKILAEDETEGEETSDNERQQVLRDLYQLDMQNEDVESEFRRPKAKRRKRTTSVRQDIVILE